MEDLDKVISVKGIPFFSKIHNVEAIEKMYDEFEIRDKDVIIMTYPKSGTHWMIEILSLIYSNGDPSWIKSVPAWKRFPWIEMKNGSELIKNKEDPRLLTSHLPIHLFPKSYFSSKAKDLKVSVEKICEFLKKKLSEEEISSVLENASFQAMEKHKLKNNTPNEYMKPFQVVLMRKGICGEWKNYFTVTQMETFNKLYQEKMEGLDQDLFPWNQC
ncbi:sulfotransferase 2A1-like [Antechinus flavipes]|uniref:sulfotransferase 2A1-like n=1 Tax=Antechinus flavipes TaxID=38775 RepID=UPI0022368D56|nr:sulfotransferase 2A1-like [Antechinus flavipes]